MLPIILVALSIFCVVFMVKWFKGTDGFSIFMLVPAAICLAWPLLVYTSAVATVSNMMQIDNRIKVVADEIALLDKRLDTIVFTNTGITLNADTPVASMIKTRMKMTAKLISYKDGKFILNEQMLRSCLGLMSAVTNLSFADRCDKLLKAPQPLT
jgi:hypothetical protein